MVYDWLERSQWKKIVDFDATYEQYAAFIIVIVVLWLALPINKICSCCDRQAMLQEEMKED